MKKQVIKILLALFITIFTFCGSYAQSVSVWDGTSEMWTQGQGTESSPYLIENAQQLAFIAEMVNGGVSHYNNTWFKLTTNVYIDSTTSWQPIGLNETYYFGGHFDGDNHNISLYLHTSTLTFVGLFGYTRQALIKNLTMDGEIVCQNGRTGMLIGYANSNDTIINCYNSGNIHNVGTYNTGGIVGQCDNNGVIINCHNEGTITGGNTYVGGIIGYIVCGSTVSNCTNTGNIVSGYTAGGIIGEVYEGSYDGTNIRNVSLSLCSNAGNIVSGSKAGGIIGSISSGTSTYSINECFNIGVIQSSSDCGGILGSVSCNWRHSYTTTYTECSGCFVWYILQQRTRPQLSIKNSYNTGSVSANTYCGGILGKSYASDVYTVTYHGTHYSSNLTGAEHTRTDRDFTRTYITNCYNSGTLNASICGGVAGSYLSSFSSSSGIETVTSISNCHYLNTCGHNNNTAGTAKTEALMKSSSFPVILNSDVFMQDLTPNINHGYPIFKNEICDVITQDADNINFTFAKIRGIYLPKQLWPGGEADVVGFEYKPSSAENYITVYTNVGSPAEYQLTGLQSGTSYSYRFFVQKNGGTFYGDELSFTTLACDLQASISESVTEMCNGETATFTASCSSAHSNMFTYQWNNNEEGNIIQVNDGAPYTVTVQDTNGCTTTALASVVILPLPQGVISGNTTLCPGESTVLTASGANRYNWSTGASSPTITVNTSGTYTCTFTNSYNCSMTQSVEVSVLDAPTVSGELNICEGGSTTLTASGGASYVWNNGASTPSITVNNAGIYTVTATSGNCSATASVTTAIIPIPQVTISGNPIICSGVSTTLTASPGSSYLWSTGETTPSISVNSPGTYSVTVTNSNGCSNSATQTVLLMEPTTISGNSHICSGESTTLSAIGTGSYQWSNGANTPSITVNTPGTYSVTVSLPNGCSSSATIEVTAASLPTPSISGNNVICEGQSTTLTATGGNSYSWNTGSTNSSISINQSGVYTVTATNTEGCSASTSTTVTVNPLPNVSISGNNSFCQSGSTTLTASGANTYLWSNDSTLESISVSDAGNYTVTGTDANGCTNTASQTVSVNPTYNIPLTHSICEGESYNFYGQNLTSAGTYTHTLQTISGCDSMLTLTLTVKTLPTISISGNTTICEGQSTTLTATGGNS